MPDCAREGQKESSLKLREGLGLKASNYPLFDRVCGVLYCGVGGIQEGHRGRLSRALLLQPAVEVKLFGQLLLLVALAPGGPGKETAAQDVLVANKGQVMRAAEVAAFEAGLDIVGDGKAGAEEGGWAAALADVFCQAQPGIEELAVAGGRVLELFPPEEVGLQEHGRGEAACKLAKDGGLTGGAGAADKKERQALEGVRVAANRTDGQC